MAELTKVDVEALVRDARAGDSSALGQLYDTYRDRVARFATGRLGDAEKAEDVTSETFEAVCRNLGSYRAGTDFDAWLFTIAHRRVADHFRRRFRRREVELDEAAHSAHRGGRDAVPVSLPAVDGPEEAVLAAEQRAEVAGAFRRLRSDQQEVLALRVLGGLSAAQVGEVLGKSEGAVRVAQHRALRSLREAMGVTAG
ncbi:MAG TPA: sigma-70 family RNA polymerase sigma factor [Actinomycetes bacterium]|nr:sigma-70 family RNA polymerase sigma factor [Actinomycetes bacterium]